MAGWTYTQLQTAVTDLSPSQISTATAQNVVNRAYQYVLRMRDWWGLRKYTTFATVADKTAGTITVTLNSTAVVGVGTAFATGDVGRYLQVGSRESIRITAVADATHLTLEQAWGEATLAATSYLIYSLRYVMPSDARRIIQLRGPIWFLGRRNPGLVDAYDPARVQRGNGLIFYEAELRADGTREFEMWPVPQDANGVAYAMVYQQFGANLSAGGDTPVIAAEAVMYKAQAEGCRLLYAKTGEQSWLLGAADFDKQFATGIEMVIREDRRLRGSHPTALDSDDMVNPGDPSFRAWARQWNQLGLTSVA